MIRLLGISKKDPVVASEFHWLMNSLDSPTAPNEIVFDLLTEIISWLPRSAIPGPRDSYNSWFRLSDADIKYLELSPHLVVPPSMRELTIDVIDEPDDIGIGIINVDNEIFLYQYDSEVFEDTDRIVAAAQDAILVLHTRLVR